MVELKSNYLPLILSLAGQSPPPPPPILSSPPPPPPPPLLMLHRPLVVCLFPYRHVFFWPGAPHITHSPGRDGVVWSPTKLLLYPIMLNPYAAGGKFDQYKMVQKSTLKWLKSWHMCTHLRVLSERYPMNTNMTGFRWFSTTKVVSTLEGLNLPMLRLLSSKALERKDFWNISKPCHVGIHWISLAENSQMSTHMSGFQLFFSVYFWLLWALMC